MLCKKLGLTVLQVINLRTQIGCIRTLKLSHDEALDEIFLLRDPFIPEFV